MRESTSGTARLALCALALLAALARAAATPDEQARAPQKILTPIPADGVDDAATFGPGAAEVSVYDRRGRRVFHAARQGAPIVWNGRDAAGRVVEPGIYVARIKKTDAGVCYQSFVLVR